MCLAGFMKKGQIYEGTAIETSFPDKAVILTEETDKDGVKHKYYVEVKGVLPGQTVKYIVKKARSGKCSGRLLEVIKKAPSETEKPACANFGKCGGCSYQTLPYQAQLKLKENHVLKLLGSVLKEGSYIFDGILKSPCTWEYRNKMEFSFGDEYKDGPLSLGLHKKGSIHDIINASGCKIIHSDYSKILDCIHGYFLDKNIPHYNKNTHTGILRHLLVRRSASTGEIMVVLVTSSGKTSVTELEQITNKNLEQTNIIENKNSQYNLKGCENIASLNSYPYKAYKNIEDGNRLAFLCLDKLGIKLKELELEGEITGFLHIINDGLGDVVKSDETHIIFGKDWITEEILGLKFKVSVFSFFQTNTKGAEVLYRCVRNYILGQPVHIEENVIKNIQENTYNEKTNNYGLNIQNNIETDTSINTENNAKSKILQISGNYLEIPDCIDKKNSKNLKDKVVFDLYSGTGTIAQIIAPIVKKVTGVEIIEEAVEAAKQNAAGNGLSNCEFIAGDVLKVLENINEKPDFIILDPPREGVNPKALKKIGEELKVPGMVYISCKPTSLVRDIVELQKYGYKVERVCCVDMFPQTGHIETICKLTHIK